jgi:hypothetical protein
MRLRAAVPAIDRPDARTVDGTGTLASTKRASSIDQEVLQ